MKNVIHRNPSHVQELMDILWEDYTTLNPSAQKIYDLFTQKGETVANDHIAFRTFQHPKVGIAVMEKPFLALGYRKSGDYQFIEKKLFAQHYEHSDSTLPKIFISELKLAELNPEVAKICHDLIEQIPAETLNAPLLCTSGKPWNVSFATYNFLKEHSEYAAWVSAFGFRVNHFTVLVNQLKTYNSIQKVNALMKEQHFQLNASGGEIKGTPEELLEQSSTLAYMAEVAFTEGKQKVPACYYEFAKRYPTPQGNLYQGFIAKSADKIFESTNKGQ